MLTLIAARTVASLIGAAVLATALPWHGQALAAQPTAVKAAPSMPSPAGIKPGSAPRPISVPAAASMSTGVFTIYSGLGRPVNRTTIKMTPGPGTPLMADWNGDGLATPGRYDNGRWFKTDAAAGSRDWELLASFGGAPGDIPITAHFDTDRYPDLAVFNNGTWKWQESTKAGVRTEDFGAAGDLPVVGDWDGNGRDDIGVFRAGSFILRYLDVTKPPKVSPDVTVQMVPEAKAAIITFPFGQPGDIPIAGDWNADGKATVGVVRGASQWILSAGVKKLKKTTTLTIPLAADQVPLVGTQATGIFHCPTASRNAEAEAMKIAARVKAPPALQGDEKGAGFPELKATVLNSLRYVMVNDYTKRLKDEWKAPYWDAVNLHKTQEEAIRRSGNSALAAAIMLTSAKWQGTNNISRAQMLAYAKWQIRALACQHASITPGGWGLNWQSALWSTTIGQAAWLLWPKLTPFERAYVAAMVSAEADAVAARGPKYWKNREGAELAPGNSKADEDSWDMTAPALALAMMPNDKRAKTWRKALVEYGIAAFSRPSDLTNNVVVNGVNISRALPGTNANEDGTVTNHGVVNPDYTQNVIHPWWGASMLRVAGVPVPEAMFLNTDIVYRALAEVNFPSPPYASPGGTVYQPGGQIYYPMGAKWGTRRPATFAGVDGYAALYSPPDTKAAENFAAHVRDVRGMQLRFPDGHIYAAGNGEESYGLGKEEYALGQLALAWWSGAVKSGPKLSIDRKPVPEINLNPRGADR